MLPRIMRDLGDYRTKSFQVDGVDSTTGITEEYGRTYTVNKRLKNAIHGVIVKFTNDSAILYGLRAEHINRNGLSWTPFYTAVFHPNSTDIEEEGEGTLDYWLDFSSNPALERKETAMPLNVLVGKLWRKSNDCHIIPKTLELIFRYWKSGKLKRDLDAHSYRLRIPMERLIGIEVEFTGISRDTAARTVAQVLGTSKTYVGGVYNKHIIPYTNNHDYIIMRDASIDPECSTNRRDYNHDNYKCELVSPILKAADIGIFLKIINALKARGAKTNRSCGIHIHVNVADFSAIQIRNLVNIVYSKEDLLYRALDIDNFREHWCKKANKTFVSHINDYSRNNINMNAIKNAWYNGNGGYRHYDSSRYHLLNLHSFFEGKGVEFRCFNGSLSSDVINNYVLLVVAIVEQAKAYKKTSAIKTHGNDKIKLNNWIEQMGLKGPTYKSLRNMLTKCLIANMEAA